MVRDFVEFLSEYLSDELSASERAEFKAHLAECPPRVAYRDTYQKTIQFSKTAYALPDAAVPDEVPEELVRQ
jgi:anti-sigma factor RsiW